MGPTAAKIEPAEYDQDRRIFMSVATKQTDRIETRHFCGKVELRKEGGKTFLTGRVVSYNELSNVIFGFREKIIPGAFTESIGPEGDDARALAHHSSDSVLGRVSAGTLKLDDRSDGLYFEIEMPDTTYARDLIVSIERGDITGMSFGFRTVDDKWDFDDETGVEIRTVIEAKLREISPVAWPAYPQTIIDTESRAMESTLVDIRAKLAEESKGEESNESGEAVGLSDSERQDIDLWRTQVKLS